MLLPGAANRDPRLFEDPARVRHRPRERQLPRGLRARHPPLRRRPPRPGRGPGHDQPAPRPHLGHRHLRGRPRPGRRPPLRVPPDLLPPRPRRASSSSSPRREPLSGRSARRRPSSSLSWTPGGPAVVPPSTGSTMPVIWAERSLARNTRGLGDVLGLALAGQRLGELQHRVHVVGGHRGLDLARARGSSPGCRTARRRGRSSGWRGSPPPWWPGR